MATQVKEDKFTHATVQLNLIKGETTQGEVLGAFGTPNIATLDGDGNEVWTYQKRASVSQMSGKSATITIDDGTHGGGTTDEGTSSSNKKGSTRAMTLIIKFDESKVVSDFKSMYSSF